MNRIAFVLLVASAALPIAASAQFRNGHAPDDLADYDWTAWLVGEWEGTSESEGRTQPYRQSFSFSPDRRYVITHNQRGDYRGFGVFSYYPVTGEAYGQWFGTEHDTNDGWATREGDTMTWIIRRLGARIERVRTRTGPDSYVVDNEVVGPDGTTIRSREVMNRVTDGTGARPIRRAPTPRKESG